MSVGPNQKLLLQLEDKNNDIRREAAQHLGALGDAEAIIPILHMAAKEGDSLWHATKDGELLYPDEADSPFVTAHKAIQGLLAEHGHWEEVRQALVFRDPGVRAQAAWVLGHVTFPEEETEAIVTALRNAISDPDPAVIVQALNALVQLEQVEERLVVPLLRLPDALLNWTAVRALCHCKVIGDRSLGFLVNVLLDTDESNALRCMVASNFVRHPDPRINGPLVSMLMDPYPNIRLHSAITLGKLKAVEAETSLFQTLIDEDEMVRYAAGIALGQLGDVRTIPFLLRAKHHGDMFLQNEAEQTIQALGVDALGELISVVRNDTMPYRLDAIDIIGDFKDPRAAVVLIESLLDEDLYIHARNAVLKLDKEAIPPLIFVAGNREAPPVFQEKAIRLLVELKATECIDTLIKELTSPEPSIRSLCARMLGDFADQKAIKPLRKIIKKGSKELDEVVAEAMLSLGKLKDDKSLKTMITMLDHMDSKVRGYAIAAIGELGHADGVQPILDQLTNPTADNRSMMIQSLSKIGDTRAVEPLLKILDDARLQSENQLPGGYLGSYAIQALAKLGEGSIVPLLLSDWEEEMEGAIESLGESAIPYLEKSLEYDRDAHVRALAAEAIGFLGQQRSMGPLIVALQDDSDVVRNAAAWALNQIHSLQI